MPKISRYNHFHPWQDGYVLAYNALSGAVALMTQENLEVYQQLAAKLERNPSPELTESESELLKQLEYGCFVHTGDVDEITRLKLAHNLSRFNRTGLGLVIAPTMACNMACTYCFEKHTATKMSPKVIEAVIEFVEKQARQIGALDVGWYGGEPLLALDVIEDLTESFLDLGQEYKFDYSSSIVTNGYLLTPETVDRLMGLRVFSAQVTLDGPARLHNTKRPLRNGGDSFDRIIVNVQAAVERKMQIGVRVNVDKSFTVDDISELLDELVEAGLRDKVGVYFGMVEAASQVCSNIAEACYEVADFSQIEVQYYHELLQRGFVIQKLPSPISTFCMTQTVNAFLVDPEGWLYRCWNDVGDQSKASGTIMDEINLLHPNFTRLFEYTPFEDSRCLECSVLPVCMGGCPARRVDRGLSDEQMCEGWKHNLQPMLEIIAVSRQQEMQRRQQAQQASEVRTAGKE
jgi:uncharacterized protein